MGLWDRMTDRARESATPGLQYAPAPPGYHYARVGFMNHPNFTPAPHSVHHAHASTLRPPGVWMQEQMDEHAERISSFKSLDRPNARPYASNSYANVMPHRMDYPYQTPHHDPNYYVDNSRLGNRTANEEAFRASYMSQPPMPMPMPMHWSDYQRRAGRIESQGPPLESQATHSRPFHVNPHHASTVEKPLERIPAGEIISVPFRPKKIVCVNSRDQLNVERATSEIVTPSALTKQAAKKKRAYDRVPESERKRKAPKHQAPALPIGRTVDSLCDADLWLVQERNRGRNFVDIKPEWERLASQTVAESTLPNRYTRIMFNIAPFSPADDAALMNSKKEVEMMYEKQKWGMVADSMSINTGGGRRNWDAAQLKRRWETLMEHGALDTEPDKTSDDGMLDPSDPSHELYDDRRLPPVHRYPLPSNSPGWSTLPPLDPLGRTAYGRYSPTPAGDFGPLPLAHLNTPSSALPSPRPSAPLTSSSTAARALDAPSSTRPPSSISWAATPGRHALALDTSSSSPAIPPPAALATPRSSSSSSVRPASRGPGGAGQERTSSSPLFHPSPSAARMALRSLHARATGGGSRGGVEDGQAGFGDAETGTGVGGGGYREGPFAPREADSSDGNSGNGNGNENGGDGGNGAGESDGQQSQSAME